MYLIISIMGFIFKIYVYMYMADKWPKISVNDTRKGMFQTDFVSYSARWRANLRNPLLYFETLAGSCSNI